MGDSVHLRPVYKDLTSTHESLPADLAKAENKTEGIGKERIDTLSQNFASRGKRTRVLRGLSDLRAAILGADLSKKVPKNVLTGIAVMVLALPILLGRALMGKLSQIAKKAQQITPQKPPLKNPSKIKNVLGIFKNAILQGGSSTPFYRKISPAMQAHFDFLIRHSKAEDPHAVLQLNVSDRDETVSDSMQILKSCCATMRALMGTDDLTEDEAIVLNKKLNHIFDRLIIDVNQNTKNITKEIKKAFRDAYVTHMKPHSDGAKAQFEQQFLIEIGKDAPAAMENSFQVDGQAYQEDMVRGDLSLGQAFLEQSQMPTVDLKKENLAYMQTIDQVNGIRVSEQKKHGAAQATTMNLWSHTICREGQTVDTVMRSGAFATHGRGKPGLSKLQAEYERITTLTQKKQKKALRKLKCASLESLQNEIQTRRTLTAAQAIPKIIGGIEKSLAENPEAALAALKTGSFLYTETSFLSDLDDGERAMIQDMQGCMQYLSKHLQIQFSDNPDDIGLTINADGKILVTLHRENALQKQRPFDVKALLFVQGINEKQSVGFIKTLGKESLQDKINQQSLTSLLEYTQQNTGREGIEPALQQVETHFAAKHISAKDTKGLKLISQLVKANGGARGKSCKSGKDRTGGAVIDEFADESLQDEKSRAEMRAHLYGGCSLQICRYNIGDPRYAFNEIQRPFLPEEMQPQSKFCGAEKT